MSYNKLQLSNFELKLIIIAVLIPLFLEYLPPFIDRISLPPLTFMLPLIITYFLGFMWGLVLLIGLWNLTSFIKNRGIGRKYLFDYLFDGATIVTIIVIGFISLSYVSFFLQRVIRIRYIFIFILILYFIISILLMKYVREKS